MTKRIKRNDGNRKIEADSSEPIGIVISSGTPDVAAPRFAAYVWGPVPEEEEQEAMVAVA